MNEKRYRIHHRSKLTGATGSGTGLFSLLEAQEIVKGLNEDRKLVHHWFEEEKEKEDEMDDSLEIILIELGYKIESEMDNGILVTFMDGNNMMFIPTTHFEFTLALLKPLLEELENLETAIKEAISEAKLAGRVKGLEKSLNRLGGI